MASPSRIHLGNCEVVVDANNFSCKSDSNTLEIALNSEAKLKISVKTEKTCRPKSDYTFVLLNPKNAGSESESCLQEVLRMYGNELPAMNYAANTGKASTFLEKCVTNGKYSTLLLTSKCTAGTGEIIAAITYQIVPADTQYAEIPLLAVRSDFQHKGFGCLLYKELRKRLQSVGIRTLYCWGDKESEGFWLKQGFSSIGEIDRKGRVRRLPVKSDIRKALCIPGGSTLMVSHLNDGPEEKFLSATDASFESGTNMKEGSHHETLNEDGQSEGNINLVGEKRTWEALLTSMKSKKVKGVHKTKTDVENNMKDESLLALPSTISVTKEPQSKEPQFKIMLMDMDDDNKKTQLSKVIETLGGAVTSDGRATTHIITRKVRQTYNFCLALCSGAWIVSPAWLKESLRNGRFMDELPYILEDEDYVVKYETRLRNAMLRAKVRPHGLLKGYDVYMEEQLQLDYGFLPSIVKSAGGNIISGLEEVKEPSKTMYIAGDESMEEALSARKMGIPTVSTTWLMNCIMKQELN